ncbi:hypothetical protein J1N35_014139 [Gossypium stocksii]|uniref:Uncharacterized protein n=1 Tax=Gossypium stocksii TaxID=47602 RepID=A0A9D4A7C1_9ROSI|nr:hypothetical protein J1N35_014139 [Gossypium stocksii]
MAKVRHSRFTAKKRLTVTLVLSILFMLTIVLLMLLGLGIFSLPMTTDDSSSYDLSSYRRMASERSDVEEGGETIFPNAKGNISAVPWWDELFECGKGGLAVKSKMGDALLFWSMKPDATVDAR